jgi:hypothetical protein
MGAVPLWAAERMGATRAIALNVLTSAPFRMLRRVTRRFVPTNSLEIVALEPSTALGSLRDAARWTPENIRRWVDLGQRDGARAASSITM